MNYFLKIGLVILISSFSSFTQAQEFSSFEKISEESYKVELVFKEINSFQTAEKIISSLRELKGVKDLELFYPTTTNGYLYLYAEVSVKLIVDKLAQINIELDPKSLKK